MSNTKKKITTSEVIHLLNKGYKRGDVAKHYGLTPREVKILFQHPTLKGKQARKPVSFELEDDFEDDFERKGVTNIDVIKNNDDVEQGVTASEDNPEEVEQKEEVSTEDSWD